MLQIRRASHDDISTVTTLWRVMMHEHEASDSRFQLGDEPEKAYSQQLSEMLNIPDNALFVADMDGVVVGYVLAMVLPNPPVFAEPRYGFIAELAVDPASRRLGTGHELWERAKRWFRRKGVKNVQLNVSPFNEAGVHFWESLGFRDFLKIQWCDLDGVQSP